MCQQALVLTSQSSQSRHLPTGRVISASTLQLSVFQPSIALSVLPAVYRRTFAVYRSLISNTTPKPFLAIFRHRTGTDLVDTPIIPRK